MSSFLKKITETAKTTASSIGNKSAELVSTGKQKIEIKQIEGKIKDKKLDIGVLVYAAFAEDKAPDAEAIKELNLEIKGFEDKITELENQMQAEEAQDGESADCAVSDEDEIKDKE